MDNLIGGLGPLLLLGLVVLLVARSRTRTQRTISTVLVSVGALAIVLVVAQAAALYLFARMVTAVMVSPPPPGPAQLATAPPATTAYRGSALVSRKVIPAGAPDGPEVATVWASRAPSATVLDWYYTQLDGDLMGVTACRGRAFTALDLATGNVPWTQGDPGDTSTYDIRETVIVVVPGKVPLTAHMLTVANDTGPPGVPSLTNATLPACTSDLGLPGPPPAPGQVETLVSSMAAPMI